MANARRTPSWARIVMWVVVGVLALIVVKWVLITAALLAVPFGVWWLVDRSHRMPAIAGSTPAATSIPTRTLAPARTARTPLPSFPIPVVAPSSRPLPSGPVTVPAPRRPVHATGPSVVLASDREVTVTGEERHQQVLARHHRRGTPATTVVVELVPSRVTRGTHRGEFAIEVRLGGERVGELTAAMSARYRPLLGAAGPVRGHGRITYGERGFQIDVRLPAMA